MILLALDTSSRDASIAVLRDGEIALEYNFSSRDDLSALLAPSLEFLLRSLELRLAQVDLLAAAVGPGLFTGIRVGLATLQGLNLAAGRPVIGVNSLEALACKLGDGAGTVVPLIDARRQEVYLAAYRFANGVRCERLAPRLLALAEVAPALAGLPDPVLVGSGAEEHGELLRRALPGCRIQYRSRFLASEVGRIALERFRNGAGAPLRPAYIRRPDAESRPPAPRTAD